MSVLPDQTVSEPFKFVFKCNFAKFGQLKHLFSFLTCLAICHELVSATFINNSVFISFALWFAVIFLSNYIFR